jgi:hypothetical protein
MMEWQPIETAPKDGRDVILWHPQFGICVGHFDAATADWWAIYLWPQRMNNPCKEGWFSPFIESDGSEGVECSHWMPLPPPPVAK